MSAQAPIATNYTQGYVWLFAISSLYAFLFSPYLTDMLRPDFNAHDYFFGTDFQNIWTSARLAIEGKISTLSDLSAYQQELPFKTPGFNWSYPLHLLLLALPLGLIGYAAAYTVWSLGGLAAVTAIVAKQAPRAISPLIIIALTLTSPATLTNFMTGQTGFFTAALFMGGFYFARRGQQIPAGILFGILTVKPQLGLLIPFALIVLRQWKAIAAASVTALTLMGISLAIWGIEAWQAYLNLNGLHLFNIHRDMPDQPGSYLMASIYAGLRNSGASFGLSITVQAVLSLLTLVAVCRALHRDGLTDRNMLILCLGTVMATPYAHGYDYVMVAGAMIVYAFSRTGAQPLSRDTVEYAAFSLLWALPLLTWVFKVHTLPLTPLILIFAFACVYTSASALTSNNGKTT